MLVLTLAITPTFPEPTPVPTSAPLTHVVQPGDTLFRIALNYQVTVEALRAANGLAGDTIYAGQVLVIPVASAPPEPPGDGALPAATAVPGDAPAADTAAPAGTILGFAADRDQVNLGENVTITWRTTGQAVQLCRDNVRSFFCLPVPAAGQQVFPMNEARRDKDVLPFTLMAFPNPDFTGQPATATLSVIVHCPAAWFFVDPLDECARAPAQQSRAVAQRFEHGQMIRLEATGMIFLLWDQPAQNYPYTEVPDPWQPGMPESDPALAPPSGYYQPLRGFGVLWRGEAGDWSVGLRGDLGWAVAPETEYAGAFQCNAGYGDVHARCYLLGPTGEVYVLTRGHGYLWSIWMGSPG